MYSHVFSAEVALHTQWLGAMH